MNIYYLQFFLIIEMLILKIFYYQILNNLNLLIFMIFLSIYIYCDLLLVMIFILVYVIDTFMIMIMMRDCLSILGYYLIIIRFTNIKVT